jgi:hypothetical protein
MMDSRRPPRWWMISSASIISAYPPLMSCSVFGTLVGDALLDAASPRKGADVQVETTAEQMFFVTARIQGTGGGKSWVGTGFVYSVETDKGPAHFLVTNKHVLRDAETLAISMIAARPDGTAALGRASQVNWTPFNDNAWVGHELEQVDVAVIPFSRLLEALLAAGSPAFFRSVGSDIALNSARTAELDALESVVFIGYPSGIFDTANLLPIMRRGTTATPIAVDYLGLPAFVIDASVFPGSSGSPVLLFDRGMYSIRNGGTAIGTRLMLLGILASIHVSHVEGNVRLLPARLAIDFDQPLGLGIVFRAEAIDACVDLILRRAGLARVAAGAGVAAVAASAAPSAADSAIDRASPAASRDSA